MFHYFVLLVPLALLFFRFAILHEIALFKKPKRKDTYKDILSKGRKTFDFNSF